MSLGPVDQTTFFYYRVNVVKVKEWDKRFDRTTHLCMYVHFSRIVWKASQTCLAMNGMV